MLFSISFFVHFSIYFIGLLFGVIFGFALCTANLSNVGALCSKLSPQHRRRTIEEV